MLVLNRTMQKVGYKFQLGSDLKLRKGIQAANIDLLHEGLDSLSVGIIICSEKASAAISYVESILSPMECDLTQQRSEVSG